MDIYEPWFWGLTALSLGTAFLSAISGAGGGAIMIAVMAMVMPASAIIPVHGAVQFAANFGRAGMSWRHIHWPTLAVFVPFSVLGAILASTVLVQLPTDVLQISIGLFILYLCWGPGLPKPLLSKRGTSGTALLTGFLSLFVGATGPLVAAYMRARFSDRFQTVATFSGAMCWQHAPKALVFGFAGFSFKDWWLVIAAMVVAGLIGTKIGLSALGKISNAHFDWVLKVILTLLAIRLVFLS